MYTKNVTCRLQHLSKKINLTLSRQLRVTSQSSRGRYSTIGQAGMYVPALAMNGTEIQMTRQAVCPPPPSPYEESAISRSRRERFLE